MDKHYLNHPTTTGARAEAHFFSFLLKTLLWGALTLLIARQFALHHFWVVVLSVFFFSLPMVLCGVYSNTVRQIRRLTFFQQQGWIFRLVSARLLKSILWMVWALGTSFFMLIQFHTYSELEWRVFFMTAPLFWLMFKFARGLIAREIAPYLITELALRWTRRLCPLLMLLVYFTWVPPAVSPEHSSLPAAIDAQKMKVAHMTGSTLVREASQFLAVYQGIKLYFFGQLDSQHTFLAWLLIGIGEWVVFFNACTILSCFLIPRVEYRRIVGPLTDSPLPAPLSAQRITMAMAVATFVSLFIYLPIFAYMEGWAQQTPKIQQSRQEAENWAAQKVEKVEQIDDAIYKKGTIAKLEQARLEAWQQIELSQTQLAIQIDQAFDRLERNIDDYLDWYYSLAGEYARIAKLLVGELEAYMMEKLEQALMQGDAFKEIQLALDHSLSAHQEVEHSYQQAVHDILQVNRIEPPGKPIQITQRLSSQEVLISPITQEMISLQSRLGGGAVAGVVTAAITGKIMGKLASKNIFKLAANAVFKIVAGKTAGAAAGASAGAVAGAAIGSVVPGPGTAVGAALGGIIGGLGAGVAVDKMLIELEEAINRDKFKGEILSVIHEARTEFKTRHGIADNR